MNKKIEAKEAADKALDHRIQAAVAAAIEANNKLLDQKIEAAVTAALAKHKIGVNPNSFYSASKSTGDTDSTTESSFTAKK